MAKIKFVTDSASDISVENEKELDILILPFKISMGDKSYLSRVDIDNEKFYELMENYDGIPTTSQITIFEYKETFEKLYKEGYTDVINTVINSKGSATYGNSVMAAEQFYEENPDAKGVMNIYNIDSRSYTGGYGYPVVEAAKKAQKGQSVEEIINYLNDWFEHLAIFFAPYTLKYAKKSGRIPSAAAFVGEVMGLRPIMKMQDWKITTETKVRGDKAIIPKIIECCTKEIIPKTPYCILYGNDTAVRDEMVQAMTKKMGYPPAESFQIGNAVAANSGPKVVGVIFKSINTSKE